MTSTENLSRNAKTAVVLLLSNPVCTRFYSGVTKRGIQTAWSLAGSKMFLPDDLTEINRTVTNLETKGYQVEKITISIDPCYGCSFKAPQKPKKARTLFPQIFQRPLAVVKI